MYLYINATVIATSRAVSELVARWCVLLNKLSNLRRARTYPQTLIKCHERDPARKLSVTDQSPGAPLTLYPTARKLSVISRRSPGAPLTLAD